MIPLRDLPHTGDAEAVGGFIPLGGGEIRVHQPAQGVLHPQHEEALVRLAADGDPPVRRPLAPLDGVVQGVAQQGAQVHLRHRQLRRQGDGEVRRGPLPLQDLRLGGEDHIGGLVLADAPAPPEGRGVGQLIQIAGSPLVVSALHQATDHRQVVPQVVAEAAHLGLLLPEALVVDLPQSRQTAGLLQPLVVRQDQNGQQQHQGGQQREGQHHHALVHGHGIDLDGLVPPEGQQYHGDQSAQGHGRQTQHQLPQLPGEHHRLPGQAAAQQQPQRAEHQRAGHAYQHVIERIPVDPLHIGVQQGAHGHLQAEEDDAYRQPPHPVAPGGQEEQGQEHRQRIEQIGVPDPDHHAAGARQGQKEQRLPEPPSPEPDEGRAEPVEEKAAGRHRQEIPEIEPELPENIQHLLTPPVPPGSGPAGQTAGRTG